MGGGGGGDNVKYVGPTKEELAIKQAEYDKQIQLLQEQNKTVQGSYDKMRLDSERALAERTSLMQQELARQQKSYDDVLGVTKKSLADSQAAQEAQGSLMKDLTVKQESASKLQTAQAEKDTIKARDSMALNKRSVDTANKAVFTRRRRRGLMSALSNPMSS
jgi:hypothetical protein